VAPSKIVVAPPPPLDGGPDTWCSSELVDSNVLRYYERVIVSFADRDTERLASGRRIRRFTSFESIARRKLRQLDIAGRLDDLKVPPGNRLEALKGNRKGQMSIRINDQWRVCFRWTQAGPADVEIVDYH
jgi:proteic killer suppression protein